MRRRLDGVSFSATTFTVPTTSLTIDFADALTYDLDVINTPDLTAPITVNETGGAAVDLSIRNLGDVFNSTLNIDLGGGTDRVAFLGDQSFGELGRVHK